MIFTYRKSNRLPMRTNTIINLRFRSEFPDSKILEMDNTLLSIYRSIVTETHRLPSQVYQNFVYPSLVKLGKDYHRMGIVAQETSTLQLTSQLENKGTTMTPSASMEEVKNKVGKLFNRPTSSFWSKKSWLCFNLVAFISQEYGKLLALLIIHSS